MTLVIVFLYCCCAVAASYSLLTDNKLRTICPRYRISTINSIKKRTEQGPTVVRVSVRGDEVLPESIFSSVNSDNAIAKLDIDPLPKKVRKGAEPEFAIENDSTKESPFQWFLVFTHFLATAVVIFNSISSISFSSAFNYFELITAIYLSIFFGDIGTGIFHWSVDNYGSLRTPIFGSVCVAFQGHHLTPWTITFRSFVNNVYKIAFGTLPALLLSAVLPMSPFLRIFFVLFINWWMISQEFHKYAHMREVPPTIKFLQDKGIILSRKVASLCIV